MSSCWLVALARHMGRREAEQLFGEKDAAPIVIDEIAGMLLTYYAVPVALVPSHSRVCVFSFL